MNVIFLLLFMQQVYSPADFTQVSGPNLKARHEAAVTQGRRGNDDMFWVAYQFPVRAGVRVMAWGDNLSISSTTSSDGIEWIPKDSDVARVAIFLLIAKADGVVQKTRLVDLNQNFRVHDRRVYWMGEANADESVDLLSTLLVDSPQRIGSSLAHYLTLHDSPAVAERLLQIARTASNPEQVRSTAIMSLGREASRKALDGLVALASDPNTQVERQAVMAIGRRTNDEAIPALIRIAKEHPNASVRSEAIRVLGQKKDPRVVDFLEQVLKKK